MDTNVKILIGIGAGLAAIILILILVKVMVQFYQEKKGVYANIRVERLLRRFAGIRHFQVLNDITLPLRGKDVKIDHILVGFFGILLITVRNSKGAIYGSGRDKNWVRVVTKHEQEKRGTFANPIPENQDCLEAVRDVLRAQNIYKISIENYIVFGSKSAVLYTDRNLPVLTFPDFAKLLKKSKYSADGDVDVEKISDVLRNASK